MIPDLLFFRPSDGAEDRNGRKKRNQGCEQQARNFNALSDRQGGDRVGRAIAQRFAAEGYHVVAMDIPRQEADLKEAQTLIREAGFIPVQRTTHYERIERFA